MNKSPCGNTVNQFDCSVNHLKQRRRQVLLLNLPPVFCQPPRGGNCPGPVGSAFSPVLSHVQPRLPPNPHPPGSWPVAEGPRLSGERLKPTSRPEGQQEQSCWYVNTMTMTHDNGAAQPGVPRAQTMSAKRRLLRETEKIRAFVPPEQAAAVKQKRPWVPGLPFSPDTRPQVSILPGSIAEGTLGQRVAQSGADAAARGARGEKKRRRPAGVGALCAQGQRFSQLRSSCR